jgi:hypothetical protein
MTGTIGLWLRIALIAASGWLMSIAGVSIYDPVTETISIHVDDLAALIGAVASLGTWKAWHSRAKKAGGVT